MPLERVTFSIPSESMAALKGLYGLQGFGSSSRAVITAVNAALASGGKPEALVPILRPGPVPGTTPPEVASGRAVRAWQTRRANAEQRSRRKSKSTAASA